MPIFISVYAYFDTHSKKLFFSIYIFGFIKIISGYVCSRKKGGVYVHVKNKAYIIDFQALKNLNSGSRVMPQFIINNLYLQVNISSTNFYGIFLPILFTNIAKNLLFILEKQNNVKNSKIFTNICFNDFSLSISFRFTVIFNLFCIISKAFTNYIIKGENYAKKRKKQGS